jgi:hypothetical protein
VQVNTCLLGQLFGVLAKFLQRHGDHAPKVRFPGITRNRSPLFR